MTEYLGSTPAAPFSAFAQALENITGDYKQKAYEQAIFQRDRAAQLQDIAAQRQYESGAREQEEGLAEKQMKSGSDIEFQRQLDTINQLDPAKAHQALVSAAQQMGVDDAASMSPGQLFVQIQANKNKADATSILSNAIANVNASVQSKTAQVQGESDPALIAAQTGLRLNQNAVTDQATLRAYDKSASDLQKYRQQDPSLQGAILTYDDLAHQKAKEFLQQVSSIKDPAQQSQILMSNVGYAFGVKTPQQAVQTILANPGQWAMNNKVLNPNDTTNVDRNVSYQTRYGMLAARPEIADTVALMNKYAVDLTKDGLVPGVPWEQQTAVQKYWKPDSPASGAAPSAGPATPPVNAALSPQPAAPAAAAPPSAAPAFWNSAPAPLPTPATAPAASPSTFRPASMPPAAPQPPAAQPAAPAPAAPPIVPVSTQPVANGAAPASGALLQDLTNGYWGAYNSGDFDRAQQLGGLMNAVQTTPRPQPALPPAAASGTGYWQGQTSPALVGAS